MYVGACGKLILMWPWMNVVQLIVRNMTNTPPNQFLPPAITCHVRKDVRAGWVTPALQSSCGSRTSLLERCILQSGTNRPALDCLLCCEFSFLDRNFFTTIRVMARLDFPLLSLGVITKVSSSRAPSTMVWASLPPTLAAVRIEKAGTLWRGSWQKFTRGYLAVKQCASFITSSLKHMSILTTEVGYRVETDISAVG